MKKLLHILSLVMSVTSFTAPAQAADVFPTSGIFYNVANESDLNFAKKYWGFPDVECAFGSPLKKNQKSGALF
jgi:hypothetical protein